MSGLLLTCSRACERAVFMRPPMRLPVTRTVKTVSVFVGLAPAFLGSSNFKPQHRLCNAVLVLRSRKLNLCLRLL